MASIKPYKDRWRAQIYVGGIRASGTFSTEEIAKSWARAIEAKLKKKAELRELLEVGADIANFPTRVIEARIRTPLSPEQIISASLPRTVICGIYFLILKDQIIYIGQSKNVLRRIARHIDNGRRFDQFSISPCLESELDEMERTYITALIPEENMTFGNAA